MIFGIAGPLEHWRIARLVTTTSASMYSRCLPISATENSLAHLSICIPLHSCSTTSLIGARTISKEPPHDTTCHPCQRLSARASSPGTWGQRAYLRYLRIGPAPVLRVRRQATEGQTLGARIGTARCTAGP